MLTIFSGFDTPSNVRLKDLGRLEYWRLEEVYCA